MTILVHIERLVLDGLSIAHTQRPLLQAAIEAELARQIAEGGLSPAFQAEGAWPSLRASDIQLQSETHPTHLGTQIAQAVYKGMER